MTPAFGTKAAGALASGTNSRRRRSIRLRDFDYAQAGAYFVTTCTAGRKLFFGEPAVRQVADSCWNELPRHFPNVRLDEWVIMPNHVHGILILEGRGGVQLNAPTTPAFENTSVSSPPRGTLSVIIRTYNAAVTTQARALGWREFGWQRNYYEHIVRDDDELARIREYIRNNPFDWDSDEDNPANIARKVAVGRA
jgi:putative transposase